MPTDSRVRDVIAFLRRKGTRRNRDGMARYAIVAPKVFGVSVSDLRQLGKRLGRDHALALALWKSGWYEARMLTAFVDEPEKVTPAQMDRWAKDFDNWAICDTLCFHLFDRTPHRWKKINAWSRRREEFVKRAAFALLASVALHDKQEKDVPFRRSLVLIERAAPDERNFVKKGVSWALRGVGRRSRALNRDAVALAKRLAASSSPSARWVGKDAFRELTSPMVQRRLKE
ncbi:MAG TPA: DNA alkylation repair protein [Vicinamibacterales bacterium]|nr:DNA alkylation repair protein [Vicinamibacterales bacterium]